jgi:2-methylcitrate dehydratase
VALWRRISTVEDPAWTARYHAPDPAVKAFGGRVVVTLADGRVIEDEIAVADAHPLGARPWRRPDYVAKFQALAGDIVSEAERARFLATVERLPALAPDELAGLGFTVDPARLTMGSKAGIFDWPARQS